MSFSKVSFEEFSKHFDSEEAAREAYERITLPRRADKGSAGYDFYTPVSVDIIPGSPVVIPTGIRCQMNEHYFLMCVPRSGLGFKKGLRLRNTVGIIDSSYFYADNEGHIMACLDTDEPVFLSAGDRFMQGIFILYGITKSDCPVSEGRSGGIGSTGGFTS